MQQNKREEQHKRAEGSPKLSISRKEHLWRIINQNKEPQDLCTVFELNTLGKQYDLDVKAFRDKLVSYSTREYCLVCGIVPENDVMLHLHHSDDLFSPLRKLHVNTSS